MGKEPERPWLRMHTAETIVENLVRREFAYLADAEIWCLGRPKATQSRGRVVLAKAKRPSAEVRAIAEDLGQRVDYLIVIGQDSWETLTERQREALIFHECCHFAGYDAETETWGLRGHDVEAFAKEITHYGAWKSDLKAFFETVLVQGDLFPAGVSVKSGGA